MGSGVAKALYLKHGIIREKYMQIPKELMRLGKVQAIQINDELTVYNCFTQEYYGNDGKRYGSPSAIKECLEKVIQNHAGETIYMPRIGCGLAGLTWDTDVLPILESFDSDVDIVVCDI